AAQEPPSPPRFAFVKTPVWSEAEPATRGAITDFAARIGADEVSLPAIFDEDIALHTLIYDTGVARNYSRGYERGRDTIGIRLRAMIENGRTVTAVAWLEARDKVEALNRALNAVFVRYDAILTPAAIGGAPSGLATGSPVFCSLWTMLGTPAV